MLTPDLQKCLLILLSALWIFDCSHTGIPLNKADKTRPREETTSDSIPDCQKNYTREGNLISSQVYKTWVKYDHLDFRKGFDFVISTLQSHGHWILSADPDSGSISTQMLLGTKQKTGYPVTVKIIEQDSSSLVHISLKAEWGTFASPDLCSFYDEFGRIMKQASAKAQTIQPVLAISEGEKNLSSPPPPPSSPPPPPALSPSPLPPPPTPSPSPTVTLKVSQPPLPPVVGSYRQGRVIWDYVNLREGPSIHYRITGKAYINNTFEILDEDTGWLRVRLESKAEGWMSKRAASESSVTPSTQKPPSSSYDSPKTIFPKKPHGPM